MQVTTHVHGLEATLVILFPKVDFFFLFKIKIYTKQHNLKIGDKINIEGALSYYVIDEKYINSISKLYEDKELYNRLSNQSRLLSEDFSSEYFALKVLKVYETAIENYKKDNKKIINKIKNNIASRKYKKISEKN